MKISYFCLVVLHFIYTKSNVGSQKVFKFIGNETFYHCKKTPSCHRHHAIYSLQWCSIFSSFQLFTFWKMPKNKILITRNPVTIVNVNSRSSLKTLLSIHLVVIVHIRCSYNVHLLLLYFEWMLLLREHQKRKIFIYLRILMAIVFNGT